MVVYKEVHAVFNTLQTIMKQIFPGEKPAGLQHDQTSSSQRCLPACFSLVGFLLLPLVVIIENLPKG